MSAPPRASVHRTWLEGERLEVDPEEAPTTNQRERLLAGVLAALRGLTGESS